MKKVYCVAYGGGHVNLVDLVCRELQKRDDVDFRLLALTTAHQQVVGRYPSGTVRRLSDYLALFDDRLGDVLSHGQRLAAAHHGPQSGIPLIESIAYLGLSYSDLIAEVGEVEADDRFRRHGRQAFAPVRTLKRILEQERADIVLTTSCPRCEYAAIVAGNELGLETVQILDLFGDMNPLPAARHIVGSDADSLETLRRQGLEDRHFYEFGQPVFDDTARRVAAIDPHELKRRLGWNPSDRVLLLASGPPCFLRPDLSVARLLRHEEFHDPLFAILDETARTLGTRILFRLHPNERYDDYKEHFARYHSIRYINPDLNLHESIAVADAVLTHHSTVGIEAEVCGKTVITFNHLRDSHHPIARLQRPPFHFASELDDLLTTIKRAFECSDSKRSVKTRTYDSVQRIVDLLLHLPSR